MLQTRVMPCLLLQEERLVKTVKFQNPSYVGDPVNAIKIYNEKEVDELILVDIAASHAHRDPPLRMIAEVTSECFMPLCYGGGIRNTDQIKTILGLGVEKVAINSHAVENPLFIREAADRFGSQSVVAALDVKKNLFGRYLLYTHGGRRATKLDPVDFARQMEQLGAGEILLTAIDRDGTWDGYDVALIRRVTGAVTIPVIVCGGAGHVSHFREAVQQGGASALAAGSMVVYQGKGLGVLINFPSRDELKRALEERTA